MLSKFIVLLNLSYSTQYLSSMYLFFYFVFFNFPIYFWFSIINFNYFIIIERIHTRKKLLNNKKKTSSISLLIASVRFSMFWNWLSISVPLAPPIFSLRIWLALFICFIKPESDIAVSKVFRLKRKELSDCTKEKKSNRSKSKKRYTG